MAEALLRLLPHLGLHLLLVWAAVAVVLTLRPLLRRGWGAQAAYLGWCAVPAAAVGGLMPLPAVLPAVPVALWVSAGRAVGLPSVDTLSAGAWWTTAPQAAAWAVLMAIWLLGVLAVVALMWARQRAAVAALRQHPGQAHWRTVAGSSPALAGAWRPRLVLPADFEQRFDAAEQSAILAHEAAHLHRHDNRWNLLACALAALQWFNPLAWWALRRFRADQELACDAAVLALQPPAAGAAYLRALLKSDDLTAPLAPATSSWRGTHPLVERIAMLSTHRFSSTRRHVGRALAAALGLLALGAGHALQPGQGAAADKAQTVMLYLTIDRDGTRFAAPRLFGDMGKAMAVRVGATQEPPWELEVTTTAHDGEQLRLQARLSTGTPLLLVASPTLITRDGVPARFEVRSADGRHVLGVSMVARRAAAPDTLRGKVDVPIARIATGNGRLVTPAPNTPAPAPEPR